MKSTAATPLTVKLFGPRFPAGYLPIESQNIQLKTVQGWIPIKEIVVLRTWHLHKIVTPA